MFKIFIVPVILLALLIVYTIFFFRKIFFKMEEEFNDLVINIVCEKCNVERASNIKELLSTYIYKTKKVNRRRIHGLSIVNHSDYIKYSKKFYCSSCGKKHWFEIKNYNDLTRKIMNLIKIDIIYYFIGLLMIGSFVITILKFFI